MNDKTPSPVFAVSTDDKEKGLEQIRVGIQQLIWQKEYVQKQIDALPELPEDATDEMKENRAKRRVQVDSMEQKVEDQVVFYNFCKSTL